MSGLLQCPQNQFVQIAHSRIGDVDLLIPFHLPRLVSGSQSSIDPGRVGERIAAQHHLLGGEHVGDRRKQRYSLKLVVNNTDGPAPGTTCAGCNKS